MKIMGFPRPRRPQAGFTLIEMLVVFVVIGILASIAIPAFTKAKSKSKSAAIAGAFHSVRDQAIQYYTDNSSYPAEVAQGIFPPEFRGYYLPDEFSWTPDAEYTLDWENWTGLDGNPSPQFNVSVGLSVHTVNTTLGNYLLQHFENDVQLTNPDTYTFTIQNANG